MPRKQNGLEAHCFSLLYCPQTRNLGFNHVAKVGEQILENSRREWKRLSFEQRTRDLILDMINSDALDSFT